MIKLGIIYDFLLLINGMRETDYELGNMMQNIRQKLLLRK
jgi:hypothetical protein